jgi:hypothetical protein
VHDPFYQSTVKDLMYFCAGILLFVCPSTHHDECRGTIDSSDSPILSVFGSHSVPTPRKYGRILNSCCTRKNRVACHCTIRLSHRPTSSLVCQSQGYEMRQTLLGPSRFSQAQTPSAQAPMAQPLHLNLSASCYQNPLLTLPLRPRVQTYTQIPP